MNPLPLVRSELLRQAGAAMAIVLLVAVAIALGSAAGAMERAFREATTRAADRFDLVIGAPGSGAQLVLTTVYLQPGSLDLIPGRVLDDLRDDPRVLAAAPVAVTDSFRNSVIVGTSRSFLEGFGMAEGRLFSGPGDAVIGSAVPMAMGEEFSPAHGSPAENMLESHEHARTLGVVGRLAPTGTPWDRAIVVPIETLWDMHAIPSSQGVGPAASAMARGVPAIVVKPRSVADAYALRAQYRRGGTTALFPAEALVPLYRVLGDARTLANGMTLAFQLLVVAAVTLALFALMAGRRQSLGVLRALGAPAQFIFASVWLQAVALLASGVLLGAGLSAVLLRVMGARVAAETGLAIAPSLGVPEALLMMVVIVAGALLAALPAWAALRAPVSRLLRGDG
jgi:putative ABC transport system permease protein